MLNNVSLPQNFYLTDTAWQKWNEKHNGTHDRDTFVIVLFVFRFYLSRTCGFRGVTPSVIILALSLLLSSENRYNELYVKTRKGIR